MKLEFASTISHLETPSNGTIIDLIELPEGTLLYDVLVRVTEAWPDFSGISFGFNLNTGTPILLIADGLNIELQYADDNSVISGNQNHFYPMDALLMAAGGDGNNYLPGVLLQTATLQAKYDDGGLGSPPPTGSAEIRIVYEEPQDAPDPLPDEPSGTFPLDIPGFNVVSDNTAINGINRLATFHANRACTLRVTLDADLTGTFGTPLVGVTDPTGNGPVSTGTGQSWQNQTGTAGVHDYFISAGDWWLYASIFPGGSDYDPDMAGSGTYEVIYP